jgi:hypothetical protein
MTVHDRLIVERQVTVKGRKRTVHRCEFGCNHATADLALKCTKAKRLMKTGYDPR